MTNSNSDKVVKLPSKEIKEGSVVRLKSGSPEMTVGKIRKTYICTYFDSGNNCFMEYEFLEHEIEVENTKK